MQARKYEGRRLQMMASYVQGNNVLDLGFAQSPNALLAPYRTVGLDLNPPATPPTGYAEQIRGDVMTLADHLDGRQFDTVVCGELIEHLERPYDFLRGLRDVVVPGGRLVLSTPNPLGFPVVLFELSLPPPLLHARPSLLLHAPLGRSHARRHRMGAQGDAWCRAVAGVGHRAALPDRVQLSGDLRRRPRVTP